MRRIARSSSGECRLVHLDRRSDHGLYRLKKVQGKKKRDAAIAETERLALEAEAEKAGTVAFTADPTDEDTPSNLLGDKDEDVIF
jgi:V-type H+-transporting ATPase subunit D